MNKQTSREIFKVLPAIVHAHLADEGRVSAVSLGDRFQVSSRSLNITLKRLVQSGVLYSQAGGNNPGYGFSKEPKDVLLYEIAKVVWNIDYPRCLLKEHLDGEDCMVCKIIGRSVDLVINELKQVSCMDYYNSLPEKIREEL
ncbi:MAG: hypothetical protein R3Y61_07195 [Rikenellaceae bacterium]